MDLAAYSQFVAALVGVLALIVILAYLARRMGVGGTAAGAWRRGARRLSVVESLSLDPKHRLLLLRRDDREHLVLVGATGSILIETSVAGAPEASLPTRRNAEPPSPSATEAAP